VQSPLNSLVSGTMGKLDSLVLEVSDIGDEHAGAVQQQVAVLTPWRDQLTYVQAGTQLVKDPNMARGGWIAYLKNLQDTRAMD